jgi:filamentous hemagglutinin
VKKAKTIPTLLVLSLLAWIALESTNLLEPTPDGAGPSPAQMIDSSGSGGPVIRDVVVRDLDGRVAWRGDMDLGPAIARIERGERDRHRNDGSTFRNREGRLPSKPRGYYREFVVRTPGMRGVGPQRMVVGRGGDAWYTSDHYRSFVRLNIEVRPP